MTRKSKRELERHLDDLEATHQRLTLAEAVNHDLETVDAEAGIVRLVETGELRKRGDGRASISDVVQRTAWGTGDRA